MTDANKVFYRPDSHMIEFVHAEDARLIAGLIQSHAAIVSALHQIAYSDFSATVARQKARAALAKAGA